MNWILLILLAGPLFASSASALSLNGFSKFSDHFALNARSAGIIQQVHVKAGQRVKQGEVLVELDASREQAMLNKALAQEKALEPELEIAELELEKALELYDRDTLSEVALKTAENKLARIQGAYKAAQAETSIARFDLQNTRLRSPVDGRVLRVHQRRGQYVSPAYQSIPLVTLVESRQMKAIGLVSSEQWRASLIGLPATVSYKQRKFTGVVSYLGFERVKKSTGVAAYEITVDFSTDQLIPEQMPVSIEIKD